MKTIAYKIRALLVLLCVSVLPIIHAQTEIEYLGEIVISGSADDRKFGAFPIGFDFDFYGNTYNEFFVSSNCLVMFGAGSNAFSNVSIPDDGRPDNYIGAFWDDLMVHSSGDIMYQTIGTAPNRKLVIQFSNMTFWTSTVLLGTIQVILSEGSNNIQMQYKSIVDLSSDRASGGEATIGLENEDGTVGVLCSYNTPGYIYSGRAILFTPGGGTYTFDDNAMYDPVLLVNDIPRAGIPIQISPTHNSVVSETLTFQWEAASNASSYFVVISQNSDMSSPIHTSADLTDLSYENTVLPDQTYYWTVNSKNSAETISWSEIWSFKTSLTPPLLAVPQTIQMEQGDIQMLTLLFTGGDAGLKTATVTSLPAEGILYQSNAGIYGPQITAVPTDVSDASHQIFYSASGGTGNGVGNFDFHFSDGTETSADETYTINVSPQGIPNFLYASKELDRIEITFDRNMADPTGKHLEFAVEDNGVGVISTSCQLKAGDPTTIVVYVSPNLNTANPITVAYTRGTVESESGVILESFDFQLVGKLAQVITFDPLIDRAYGDADFTLTATASSGLPIAFSSSNISIVSVTGSTASVNNIGEAIITATQTGDDTYAPVNFERIQLVNKATATVTLSDLARDYTGTGVSATITTVPAGLNVEVTYNGSPVLPVDLGSYTVDVQIVETNYDGNASDVLNIIDLSPPVPDVASLPVLIDECSVTPVAPTATDLYSGLTIGTTGTPFPITTQGTTLITWIYVDGFGNTSTQTQSVAINDLSDPVTPTLTDQTADCSVPVVAPTTTDNCADTITGTTTDPMTYSTEGTYVINWTFDDGNGNSVNAAQNVIVDDVTDPVTPTLSDLTGACSVTAVAPTTTDACAGTITGTTTDPLTYSTEGTYVINWTFDDGNGNSIIVAQNVIVDDVTDPVTPTLPDLTGECSLTAVAPTTTDACAGTITGTTTDPLTYTIGGTHVITWTFNDGNGNSIDVIQNVFITDLSPPVIPTLADLSGECSVTATPPTTTDDCAGVVTGTTTNPLTYSIEGTYVITWTFADGSGNSINVNQNVIVTDVTPPDMPTLANQSGECSVTVVAPT
ncbi:MAG: MBG domain-containing protein, partial [Bacteroidota bacterium]|nr:MBG domain-containing protein [Bacteroidota bacterium]